MYLPRDESAHFFFISDGIDGLQTVKVRESRLVPRAPTWQHVRPKGSRRVHRRELERRYRANFSVAPAETRRTDHTQAAQRRASSRAHARER